MNVLIITTFFPPDTTIASVRPFMFAKYLQKAGHQVTVLRSGELINKADYTYDYTTLGIRVYSFLGEGCEAERFMRGETLSQDNYGKRKLSGLPNCIRTPLVWCYRRLKFFKNLLDIKARVDLQKAWIDAHSDEHFDAVYATYGSLENVYAGQYAAKVFGCKWILDLRDPIAQRNRDKVWEFPFYRWIQKKFILSADICTAVSNDLAEEVAEGTNVKPIALHNGFEATMDKEAIMTPEDGILRFCYTGIMYDDRSASSLFCAVRQLADEGNLTLDKVRFEYAGPHFEIIEDQAKKYGVEKILVNHDYVSRSEAYEIQCRSDVFLVLSWNTKYERGVLTGKFYEGIRARKPILALLTGEKPYSELNLLNEKYRYGFCYETCRKEEQFQALRDWVQEAYTCKQAEKPVPYDPKPELFTDFCYENLTKKLEQIMQE